jgi:hypothetical protein
MKNLLYLFVVSSLLFEMVSCGDNNSGDPGDYNHPYFTLEGTYRTVPDNEKERQLILTYNGETMNNSITVTTRGSSAKPQAVFVFENTVAGETKLKMTVDLNGVPNFSFEGVHEVNSSKKIKYSGSFGGPLTIHLTDN